MEGITSKIKVPKESYHKNLKFDSYEESLHKQLAIEASKEIIKDESLITSREEGEFLVLEIHFNILSGTEKRIISNKLNRLKLVEEKLGKDFIDRIVSEDDIEHLLSKKSVIGKTTKKEKEKEDD